MANDKNNAGIPDDTRTGSVSDSNVSDGGSSASKNSGSTSQIRSESNDESSTTGSSDSNSSESDSGTRETNPRDLLSARPFVRTAKIWRDKGWIGTVPLPAKAKKPAPVGWTGRAAPFPSNEQISEWCGLTQYKRGNIGLHLGWPVVVNGQEYEIIGIDVDNYEDNGKIKEGGKQLKALESTLGKLPPTWVSTARAGRGDYTSGIRFFLVPRGLAFRGQADKDIEIIQKNHRFAVVWPSYNPKSDSQYCLYSPAAWSSHGEPAHFREIPHVTELPLLPGKWIDFLTNGRMEDADGGIDMDSSVDEIYQWAEDNFNDKDTPCAYMRKIVGKWKKLITDEATSHDKVRNAHWEIINSGAEGHTGWSWGLEQIDSHWIEDVMSRSKRSVREMRGEMFRSKTNCIRKVKVKVENATSAGAVYTPEQCVCAARAAITANGGTAAALGGNAGGLLISDSDLDTDSDIPDGLENISWGISNSPDEYDMNDDGNGEFLCDLLKYKSGRVKYAEGYGWILWTDSAPDRPARWIKDEDGLIRRAFWRVKQHQQLFAEQKHREAEQLWRQSGGVTPMPALVKQRFAEAKLYGNWATKSGNNSQAEAAIRAATKFPGVTMDINELNRHPYLLGVANGVIELQRDGAVLRDAEAEDFVTYNTNVPWIEWKGISVHDQGRKLWQEYLDKFVPEELQTIYQTILGHCIMGGNPERLILVLAGGTSTGKSTMLRAIGAALGDYASTVNLTIFGDHKLNPALANAIPRRVVFTSELSAGDKLSVATVKRMTGNDMVRAELKGVNVEVQGVPQFVPIMATNVPPEIPGADEALRRRIMVLPFSQRIDDRKDEKRAAEDLEAHAAVAILAWLVEGYNMYCEMGLPYDAKIVEETNKFNDQLDPVNEFLSERVIEVGYSHVSIPEMYQAYETWCNTSRINNSLILSRGQFSRRLTSLGLNKKTIRSGERTLKAWTDVKLTRSARSSTSGVKLKLTTQSEMDSRSNPQSESETEENNAETT